MFQTKFGLYDGDSWENLFQLILKRKYLAEGYQQMPASPGDFGIEGFTHTGNTFQCYCPDNNMPQDELYEKQRDKITRDLKKLQTYQKELVARFGDVKIKIWTFISPEINRNKLLEHAKTKQNEVRALGLNIIAEDFTILLHDAEFYTEEINAIKMIKGEKISFDNVVKKIPDTNGYVVDYEKNIDRKNKFRCITNGYYSAVKHKKVNDITVNKWLDGELFLKKIESEASKVYYDLSRVISQYESELEELCLSWNGTPEELISHVRESLFQRISAEATYITLSDIRKIADHMVSKWLAICSLDFELNE